MILFSIYYFISPLLYILLLFCSLFIKKIKIPLKNYNNTLNDVEQKILNINKEIIIIHSASAGEFQQIIPLLRLIDRKKYFIINTCMSPTIYNTIKENKLVDACCYHPYDFPWLATKFFNKIKPTKYIITRHDIWPIHLYIAKRKKIKNILINANLYEKSFRIKSPFKMFSKYIFSFFDLIIAPSDRILNLFTANFKSKKIIVFGDTRYDQVIDRNKRNSIKLFNHNENIIFGSISHEDYNLITNLINRINGDSEINRKIKHILIVPHENDIGLINKLTDFCNSKSMNYSFYSKVNFGNIKDSKIIIIDEIGILADLYKFTLFSYIGGGFGKGVHSTLEPAVYGNVTCFGNNIQLLDEAIEMVKRNCGFVIENHSDCFDILKKTFIDTKFQKEVREKCNNFIEQKFDNTKKIIEAITNV